ncbi:MAG: ATP-dependent helicase HrpB [Gammaproteobacteria bacterium]|nr:ATP-dependent helicase HrpB [Gammaproteobacteria bacterium]MDH5653016.1 ATP-dependent helicase HrpB [Gammaproteobacteria bacterium]
MFPVDELLPQLIAVLAKHPNVVLQAPPGAGKTTRVPLALLDCDWLQQKKIIMLEPRRIAARAAARFMAHSLNEQVGGTIGYRVRQDSKVSSQTRVEVVTEGILTRMLQDDPALEQVGLVIFDEFHERNLNADLGLALCLDAQQGLRDDLRLLVMSATLDGKAVATLLNDAPILTSEGRSYPVTIRHFPIQIPYHRDRHAFLQAVTRQVLTALDEETGSLLVFLPGAAEINQVHDALQRQITADDILLTPLFGQLTGDQQDAAIQPAPPGKRKIVLATSIAETSLTIDGIRIVIDAGLQRLSRFDPNTGMSRLVTQPVSQAAADQRAGRAGRLEAGICYRLWAASSHLLPHTAPEMVDADLAPLVLELAQWGVNDVHRLKWLDTPPAAHLAQAGELLQQLGALDEKGMITAHGKAMATWGLHPRLAHMLICGKALGAGGTACDIAALLSERDILRGRQRDSDLHLRLQALHNAGTDVDKAALRQVRQSSQQWQQQLQAKHTEAGPEDLTGVLLAFAYPDRIGQQRDAQGLRYRLSNGRGATLTEGDLLSGSPFIVAAHLDGTTDARIFLAAAISAAQLEKYHADLITTHEFVSWDDRKGGVQARQQQVIGRIILDDREWTDADTAQIEQAMLQGIQQRGMDCLPWRDNGRDLQARINFLHKWFEADWPDMSDAALLESLAEWLSPWLSGMSRLAHLEKLDMYNILLSRLSWEQQTQLNVLAPTHLAVPSGSQIRIDYSQTPPVLAVRLQEMFGLADTPRIANGKVAVLLHLLSPARRPVQITQDLAGFWRNAYFEVKKDLKGRYPKHYWPDDPMQAEPTARAKRRKE